MNAQTTPAPKKGARKLLRIILLGGGALVLVLGILAAIFSPSKQQMAAMEKHRDSVAASVHINDSLNELKKQQAWDALPKHTRDSILGAKRHDSLAEVAANKESQRQAEQADKMSNPMAHLTLKKTSWQKGGFGAVAILSLTFQNNSGKAAKDIIVTATFTGESGKELGQRTETITTVVPPGKTKTVSDVNFGIIPGQAEGCRAELVSADFN